MISFTQSGSDLLLRYEPDFFGDRAWVLRKLLSDGSVTIRKAFHFEKKHFHSSDVDFHSLTSGDDIPDELEYVNFKIGTLSDGYFKIDSDVLGIDFELFFDSNLKASSKFFIATRDIAIWPKLDKLKPPQQVYIGGSHPDSIPLSIFEKLIKKFPNSTELDKYAASRISSILRDDLDLEVDAESLYEKYIVRKTTVVPDRDFESLSEDELSKFTFLEAKLTQMLSDEGGYTEFQWQQEILGILRLLFPKYIHVFREGSVIDKIFGSTRSVVFLLVDYNGNIDIAEIKKPKDKSIVSTTLYRDNHVPLRELSGTIMQVEKYIYHLNRSAERGEKKLIKQFGKDLPDNFEIKITNPKGIVIMGRDHDLNERQLKDFEIIKRKYNNVIDVVTYDDLLRRIGYSIEQLQKVAT